LDNISVSKLGFGTSRIGGASLVNGKRIGVKPLSKWKAVYMLKYAYDNGINFFDTSDKYGNAEELLGEALSRVRHKVVIATKCGLTDKNERDFSIPYINVCIENSLRRLKTDYLDIFQLAKPYASHVNDKLISFFEKKIEEGKIRRFGISVIGDEDSHVFLGKKIITSFQIFYNLLFVSSHELINKCAHNKRFVIVRSPLNSGILSGKYTAETKFDKQDPKSRIFHGNLLKKRLEYVDRLKCHFCLSEDEILSFSLNFVLSNNNVNVVIPAASHIKQLQDYIRIFNRRKRFDEYEMKEIVKFIKSEKITYSL